MTEILCVSACVTVGIFLALAMLALYIGAWAWALEKLEYADGWLEGSLPCATILLLVFLAVTALTTLVKASIESGERHKVQQVEVEKNG